MTVQYLGYSKRVEYGEEIVYAYGKFEDGHKFYIRTPMIPNEPMFDEFVKDMILLTRPEDIDGTLERTE
jgi:hypothetical protein